MDIVPEKVELINSKKSPIQDEYIEKYLAEKELDLTATLDAKEAYSDADFVVIAAPTKAEAHSPQAAKADSITKGSAVRIRPHQTYMEDSFMIEKGEEPRSSSVKMKIGAKK